MRESTVEKAVCDHGRKLGCMVLKLSGPNQKGQPDRMFLKDGRALFIEFKRPGQRPTALQAKWLGLLREAGFTAEWADSVERGVGVLEEWIS